jgi:hypothetical protein
MSTALVRLQAEYHRIWGLDKEATPMEVEKRMALGMIIAEVQLGLLTKDQQTGSDADVVLAGEAWLAKFDAIYDPLAKTIWSPDDIVEAHRIRKNLVEILEGLKVK